MEKTKEDPTADAGVDKVWLEAILKGEIEQPKTWKPKEVKLIGATKPKSHLQELLQQFYWDLVDGLKEFKSTPDGTIISQPSEDLFDKWYENNDLDDYSHSYKLYQLLNTVARGLGLSQVTGYGSESNFQEVLAKIAQRVIDDQTEGAIEKIAEIINDKYPGLASDFRSIPSTEELNEYEQSLYHKEVAKITEGIETNVKKYKRQLAKIEEAKKTDFEKTAQELNKIVIWGESNWELVLYCLMSAEAPRMNINSMDHRANLHTMLAGDISTAKSKILKIAKQIAPKMMIVDETTKASFEGVAPTKSGEEIEEGILDHANGGMMIVEEFTTAFAKMPLMRRAMDCEHIVIHKKGSSKEIDVNTTLLAACNPRDDFFLDETEFRKQITFKEGILSRFDILIPLTATQEKNMMIVDKLSLLSEEGYYEEVDLLAIKQNLATIAQGMSTVGRVILRPEQQERMKQGFKDKNQMDRSRRLLKNRPLVLLRDVEAMTRFVNTIASVNFSRRELKDGKLYATDEDVDKAIQLWENLIQFRVQLYAKHDRNLRSVADEIKAYMALRMRAGVEEVPFDELHQEFVDIRKLVGSSTFYREIKTLVDTKMILSKGKRNRVLRLIIS